MSNEGKMKLLNADCIYSGYGNTEIIHGVSMNVKKGEIVTIIGPNGSGKSTFLKSIMGYVKIYKGMIRFESENITTLRTIDRTQRGIAYVPQLNNIFTSLTVHENLEMGGFKSTKANIKTQIESMYELFPLICGKKKLKAGLMSGGQRQMLAIAIALIANPKLILLDEPSAGLSPKIAEEIFDKINEISTNGISVIIVEQEAERSLSISDRGYVLAMGEVIIEDSADKILKHKKIRESYLGA